MCIRDRRCCSHSGGGLCAAARGRLPQLRLPGVLSSAARGSAGGAVTTVQAPPAGSRPLRPDDLCGLLDVPLTAEQLAAATAPLEPGVIVAGAGSGKTTVMAGRGVWLVATGQVEIEQVLGLTFTNKAAGELATRVRGALARAAAVQSSAVQSSAVQSSAVQSSAVQGAALAEVPPQRGLPAGEPGGGQFEAGAPGGGER